METKDALACAAQAALALTHAHVERAGYHLLHAAGADTRWPTLAATHRQLAEQEALAGRAAYLECRHLLAGGLS